LPLQEMTRMTTRCAGSSFSSSLQFLPARGCQVQIMLRCLPALLDESMEQNHLRVGDAEYQTGDPAIGDVAPDFPEPSPNDRHNGIPTGQSNSISAMSIPIVRRSCRAKARSHSRTGSAPVGDR